MRRVGSANSGQEVQGTPPHPSALIPKPQDRAVQEIAKVALQDLDDEWTNVKPTELGKSKTPNSLEVSIEPPAPLSAPSIQPKSSNPFVREETVATFSLPAPPMTPISTNRDSNVFIPPLPPINKETSNLKWERLYRRIWDCFCCCLSRPRRSL